jgi:cytochrome c oxidase subunit III
VPRTTVLEDIEIIIESIGGGAPPAGGDAGDDGGNRPRPGPPSPQRYYTGIAVGIVSILMFFMALASAYIVRKGSGDDWVPVRLPLILWGNTAILLASSLTLEFARRRLRKKDLPSFRHLWLVTTALGVLFLAGQIIAWRQLVGQGVFLSSNPASSFYFIFTGAHAVHLFGGVAALLYVSLRKFEKARISRSTAAEVTSYYWHFLDALWVFLFALLYLGK